MDDPGLPEVRYTKTSDGYDIAYQVIGDGPLDVVWVPGLASHLELEWETAFANMYRRLASFARLIRFDKRGVGLSDRNVGTPSLEDRIEDVRAVMDAVGSDRAALVGVSEGGPMSILFAATYPQRSVALVLYGTLASVHPDVDYPHGNEDALAELRRICEETWGTGESLRVFARPLAENDQARELVGRLERAMGSPRTMLAMINTLDAIDVRAVIPSIAVPTLVIHATDDYTVPLGNGRWLAEHIDGARFVEVSGEHVAFDFERFTDEVETFLTGRRHGTITDRVLTTVLFSDIVGSTKRATDLWRSTLEGASGPTRRGRETGDRNIPGHACQDDWGWGVGDLRRTGPSRALCSDDLLSGPSTWRRDPSRGSHGRGRASWRGHRGHRRAHRPARFGDGRTGRSTRLPDGYGPGGRFWHRLRRQRRLRAQGCTRPLEALRCSGLIHPEPRGDIDRGGHRDCAGCVAMGFWGWLAASFAIRAAIHAGSKTKRLMAEIPMTQYVTASDGARIAYQVAGSGPTDIVLLPTVGCIDLMWDEPSFAHALDRLTQMGRLICLDYRGSGASDNIPLGTTPTAELWMEDIRAILDAVGSQQATLIVNVPSGFMALLFAATYPDQTLGLVLINTSACWLKDDDYPFGGTSEELASLIALAQERWGKGAFADIYSPSRIGDESFRRWAGRYERLSWSPGMVAPIMRWFRTFDMRPILPAIRVPTLVLHRKDNQMSPLAAGQYLADHIANARLKVFPGIDTWFFTQDADDLLDEVEGFITGAHPLAVHDRVLATVLFTDVVGSTEHASRLGDAKWTRLLDGHDAGVHRELERYRGQLVKPTGDGILATFDGPARAIRCAQAISEYVRGLGIEIRAGLHTGEIELRGDDIGGIAVHIGQRISALAGPAEVLVSSTVKDLVIGSGIAFTDRGEHKLKGVPGSWRLYAVAD